MNFKTIILPPVNTPVWVVSEHFYYISEEPAPRREFVVCAGHVLRHNTPPGREPEIVIRYQDPDGVQRLSFVRRSGLRDGCFLTPKAAAEKAKRITDHYESSCLSRIFREKMRRPWEKYLMEK